MHKHEGTDPTWLWSNTRTHSPQTMRALHRGQGEHALHNSAIAITKQRFQTAERIQHGTHSSACCVVPPAITALLHQSQREHAHNLTPITTRARTRSQHHRDVTHAL